jgi:very-short-patch-repair endonuclease
MNPLGVGPYLGKPIFYKIEQNTTSCATIIMESTIASILEDIEAIKEKLRSSMTEGQASDWQRLLDRRLTKLKKLQTQTQVQGKRQR